MRHPRLIRLVPHHAGIRFNSSTLASGHCKASSAAAVHVLRRCFASPAVAPGPETDAPEVGVIPDRDRSKVLQLLQDIRELMKNSIGGSDTWIRRLNNTRSDFEFRRKPRIAILGDELAGTRSLVSALLQDPISDSTTSRHALLARHNDAKRGDLAISYGPASKGSSQNLCLPSAWLQTSGCEILEILDQDADNVITSALGADTVVFVVDPLRLTSTVLGEDLRSLLDSARPVIIVVNGAIPESLSPSAVRERLSNDQVVFTDSALALGALDALSEGLRRTDASPSARSRAFETFQHAYLESNIGLLQTALAESVKQDYQSRTAISSLTLAKDFLSSTLANDRRSLDSARGAVTELRRTARHASTHAKNISVINRAIEGGRIQGGVDDEVAQARQDIQTLFDGKYSWLGLVGRLRLDDVGADLASYIARQFGNGLEKQIVYETGQLSQVRHNLEAETDATIRKLSTLSTCSFHHPLSSPLLINHLSTISLSIPSFSPTTLVTPLKQRRQQLVNVSINHLQKAASQALLTTYGLAVSGLFASWWAYVPPVAAISSTTAIGLGLLSIVSSAALGQNRWSRAQHNFWKEWERITGMLRGDLQQVFVSALETRVVAKTDAAADGLDRLVSSREKRLDELEAAVRGIRDRLEGQ